MIRLTTSERARDDELWGEDRQHLADEQSFVEDHPRAAVRLSIF